MTLPDATLLEAVEAVRKAGGNKAEAARVLGWEYQTIVSRCNVAEKRGFVRAAPAPSAHVPLPMLIERLKDDYARKRENANASKLARVHVTMDGPVGMLVFGDPHLGSHLTNWPALERDINLIKDTEGLFATNIGDTGDNWTGKLAHLWADNEMSASTEARLTHWFIEELADQWLLLLYGNHDLWSGAGSALPWLAQQHGILDANWSQRVALQFPNGREVRVGAYHGANGHSMWNSVHGGIKLAKMGPRDHLICAGHIHQSQILYPVVDPGSGEWSTVLQVGSYKDISDNYGKRLGGGERNAFPSAVVIINPAARTPAGLLRVFPDTEEGADFLTYLRGKKT
jgi:hypothetical protein